MGCCCLPVGPLPRSHPGRIQRDPKHNPRHLGLGSTKGFCSGPVPLGVNVPRGPRRLQSPDETDPAPTHPLGNCCGSSLELPPELSPHGNTSRHARSLPGNSSQLSRAFLRFSGPPAGRGAAVRAGLAPRRPGTQRAPDVTASPRLPAAPSIPCPWPRGAGGQQGPAAASAPSLRSRGKSLRRGRREGRSVRSSLPPLGPAFHRRRRRCRSGTTPREAGEGKGRERAPKEPPPAPKPNGDRER